METLCHWPLATLADTKNLARRLSQFLRPGDFITLVGPLGAGKTALARDIVRALAGDDGLEVPSPTFSLIQHFTPDQNLPFTVAHADLYRLDEKDSVADLGLEEALATGILLVEWPDKLADHFVQQSLLCRFTLTEGERSVTLYGDQTWQKRLARLKAGGIALAAGRGTRMGDHSKKRPKALTPVGNQTLLDYALKRGAAAGLAPLVVNTHHLSELMHDHLQQNYGPGDYVISHEPDLLETGGGVKKALGLMREDRFAVINVDVVAVDFDGDHLAAMMALFDPEMMDCLLAVIPLDAGTGFHDTGDLFPLGDWGASKAFPIRLKGEDAVAPLLYCGVMITSPAAYENSPEGAFSNRFIFRQAQEAGRFYGYHIDTPHYHVGTPEGIVKAVQGLRDCGIISG